MNKKDRRTVVKDAARSAFVKSGAVLGGAFTGVAGVPMGGAFAGVLFDTVDFAIYENSKGVNTENSTTKSNSNPLSKFGAARYFASDMKNREKNNAVGLKVVLFTKNRTFDESIIFPTTHPTSFVVYGKGGCYDFFGKATDQKINKDKERIKDIFGGTPNIPRYGTKAFKTYTFDDTFDDNFMIQIPEKNLVKKRTYFDFGYCMANNKIIREKLCKANIWSLKPVTEKCYLLPRDCVLSALGNDREHCFLVLSAAVIFECMKNQPHRISSFSEAV